MNSLPLAACGLLCGVAFVAAHAAEPGLAEQIARCAAIAQDDARLKCYDSLATPDAEASSAPVPPPAAGDADAAALAAERALAERLANPSRAMMIAAFGAEDLPPEAQPLMPQKQIESFEARVVAVRRFGRGWEIFELDNGQVWQQSSSGRSLGLDLDQGPQPVRLERGIWGSYRIFNPANNRRLSVRRVR